MGTGGLTMETVTLSIQAPARLAASLTDAANLTNTPPDELVLKGTLAMLHSIAAGLAVDDPTGALGFEYMDGGLRATGSMSKDEIRRAVYSYWSLIGGLIKHREALEAMLFDRED
jgi:hypothetical protein